MNIQTIKNKAFAALLPLAFCSALLTSCVKDNGTYDYKELSVVTIEGIPEVTEVLAHIDNIKLSPKIIVDGKELADGDPNFTVQYRLGHKGMGNFGYDYDTKKSIVWLDLTPKSGYAIDYPANINTGLYTLWVTVTNNNDGSVTSKQYDVSVGSTTYEGWLVLCNEGSENLARLDMISKISSTRTEAIHDIAAGLPELHNANCIMAFPQEQDPGDQIHLLTLEGSYNLDAETMECDPASDEFNSNYFAFDPGETIIKEDLFAASSYTWLQKYKVCFGENGNAYVFADGSGGAAYSTAVNTSTEGYDVEFKVAPFVGFNWTRPWKAGMAANMLFYDTTNKEFRIFLGGSNFNGDDKMQLAEIEDPDGDALKLFSYKTGKDLIYMQSTRRSSGLVYSILQDASGSRYIYGINMGGTEPVQELYDADVAAPDFNNATQFAFDNRFPLLFYSVGSKLYCYNLGTKQTTTITTSLPTGAEITKLKFNLYRAAAYTSLANQTDEFLNQQYRLIVCSFDASAGDNGGKVTFFDVDGTSSTAKEAESYSGFAKIQDITYRERGE